MSKSVVPATILILLVLIGAGAFFLYKEGKLPGVSPAESNDETADAESTEQNIGDELEGAAKEAQGVLEDIKKGHYGKAVRRSRKWLKRAGYTVLAVVALGVALFVPQYGCDKASSGSWHELFCYCQKSVRDWAANFKNIYAGGK